MLKISMPNKIFNPLTPKISLVILYISLPLFSEDMISVPMMAYSLLLAGVKHSSHSAIDLSMLPPLNCGTIFQALSETPNL